MPFGQQIDSLAGTGSNRNWLTALLRLALALLRSWRFTVTHERLPADAIRSGSCETWILSMTLCRCGHCCGSCDCPRVASTRGDGCSTRVRWTISRPVRTSPHRLTPREILAIKDMVTALENQ
jgi:hypothetical protein